MRSVRASESHSFGNKTWTASFSEGAVAVWEERARVLHGQTVLRQRQNTGRWKIADAKRASIFALGVFFQYFRSYFEASFIMFFLASFCSSLCLKPGMLSAGGNPLWTIISHMYKCVRIKSKMRHFMGDETCTSSKSFWITRFIMIL